MKHSASAQPVTLIIDDEPQIRRLLRLVLEGAGYKVIEAENGNLGLQTAAHQHPDLIILDLGLPDLDGIAVLKRLREWSSTPVLILSVRETPDDKIAALDCGADDFVTKPFEAGEVLARLRALQRRAHAGAESPVLSLGKLCVDLAAHEAQYAGKTISLTPTEFSLLGILARYAGRVVTQRQLLRDVWGPQAEDRAQYTRVYMTHLRKKLTQAGCEPDTIITEQGIGYRLSVPANL
ncbi:MAG: response regulator [Kiritimatiellaceae bacterium]|nr:response regulator [Kiritimatiellaceae bacterium]